MSISRVAARRPVAVTMVVAAILVLGVVSTSRLALDWMPQLRLPVVGIVTVYPGAEPRSVESLVTNPVESAIATVPDIKDIESYSMENLSVVVLTFQSNVNGNEAVDAVNANLATLTATLPAEAMKPVVAKVDPRIVPQITIGVTGQGDLQELTRKAQKSLKPALEQAAGVATVSVVGGVSPEVTVYFDTELLRANNLTPYTLYELLQSQNALVPAGNIVDKGTRYNVRVGNPFTGAQDVADLVIGQKRTTGLEAGGFGALIPQQLFVKDVAKVQEGTSPQQGFSRVNGQPAIMLHVFKDTGANSVRVSRAVADVVKKLNQDEQLHLKLQVLTDQSQFITSSLADLQSSLIIGSLLAIASLFLFLRAWRSVLVIALAIPVSIVVTLVVMYATGLSLNMMSLGGLALGVGMLVDNAVVVLENIMRHRRLGQNALTAAEVGTNEMMLAISAGTVTTLVVFLPLAYLQSYAGQWFRDMALTVTYSISASLIVAVTIVPAAAAKFLGKVRTFHSGSDRRAVTVSDDLAVDVAESGWVGKLQARYLALLARTIRRPWPVLVLVAVLIAGGIMSLFHMPAELIPSVDGGAINITIGMPPGTPISQTDKVAGQIEKTVAEVKEVTSVWSQAGQQSDNLLNLLFSSGSNSAQVHTSLLPLSQRQRRAEPIAAEIRERIAALRLADATVTVSAERMTDALGTAFQTGATIDLFGPDLDVLTKYAEQAATAMRNAGGFSEVHTSADDQQPELIFTVNRTKALIGQMTTGLVGLSLRSALTGLEATKINRDGESIPVVLRPKPQQIAGLPQLLELPLQGLSSDGSNPPPVVKFGKVVTTDVASGPVTINHVDRQRVVSVQARLAGIDLTTAGKKAKAIIADLDLPAGVSARLGGVHATIAETSSELSWALGLAVLLVFMVMAAQFESIRYPLIIMFTVPVALGGGLALLWLNGHNLGVPSMMGLIVLIGVAVDNAIVLVDAINQERELGADVDVAIFNASRNRLRPVLMTSLATIFGLVPMALSRGEGSELQTPLAIGFMGGMISSTLLTLFITPLAYRFLSRFAFFQRAPLATEGMPNTPGD